MGIPERKKKEKRKICVRFGAKKGGIGFRWCGPAVSWYCTLSEFCCPRLIHHSEQQHARSRLQGKGKGKGQGMARRGDATPGLDDGTERRRYCSSLARCCVSACPCL
ncbi:hypothetical protein SORBI_3010G245900 [Sorghum bicolor]|uniref:Uncharacterized protein n=1 Tax=Sorghum bicolor TaxID=4558 RepID=A0A194YL92_SORBI|nr:hypothetical protein SORBI_3010G245900 [Sorghum bicolor]